MQSYRTFNSVGADHRVVSVRLRLSLRVPSNIPRPQPDWEAFARSPDHQASYKAEVRSCFQLHTEVKKPQTTYRQFLAANKEATRRWVPTKGRLRASLSLSIEEEGTTESREVLNKAKQQLFNTYDSIRGGADGEGEEGGGGAWRTTVQGVVEGHK